MLLDVFAVRYYKYSIILFRDRYRSGFFSVKSKTLFINRENYRLRKRNKSKPKKVLQNDDVSIELGWNIGVEEIMAQLHTTGHAPKTKRLLARTKQLGIQWYSIRRKNETLSSVGVVEGTHHVRFKYIGKRDGSPSDYSIALFDHVIRYYLSQDKVVDLGGISPEENNGIDHFKKGFGGEIGYFWDNFSFLTSILFFKRLINQQDLILQNEDHENVGTRSSSFKVLIFLFFVLLRFRCKKFIDIGAGEGYLVYMMRKLKIDASGYELRNFITAFEEVDDLIYKGDLANTRINVAEYENTCVYMYCPFEGETFRSFIDNNFDELAKAKVIVYKNPTMLDHLVSLGFKIVLSANNCVVGTFH